MHDRPAVSELGLRLRTTDMFNLTLFYAMKESTNKTTGSQSKTNKSAAKSSNAGTQSSTRGTACTTSSGRGTARSQSSGTGRSASRSNNPTGINQYTKK